MDTSDRLRRELAARYRLQSTTVTIAGQSLELLGLADPDTLLEELDPDNRDDPAVRDERLPYWTHVWPAAKQLAGLLLQGLDLQPNSRCLELGCGLGLVSAAARRAGLDVSVSDYEPDAVKFARYNCRRPDGEPAAGLVLDWRQPPGIQPFPIILAADVVYETRNFAPLIETFQCLLATPGSIFLAEPNRPIAAGFFTALEDYGWDYELLVQSAGASSYRLVRQA